MGADGISALLVVDLQNGFIGLKDELPVAGAAGIVPLISRLLPRFEVRIASQDWHPPDHGSFAIAHPGRRPFELGELAGREQVLWPVHCVQGTPGSELHPDFDHRPLQAIFRKGTDPLTDSYSAFADNAGRNPTGLDGYLAARGVRHLYLAGLALDYCVRYTAADARRLMPQIAVSVIVDATRPVDPRGGDEALAELRRLGVGIVGSDGLPV